MTRPPFREMAVPDDPDPRVPTPWEHQRQRAMERERIAGRREGCAVVLLAALFGLLVIAVLVAIAAPRTVVDSTALLDLWQGASGGRPSGAPNTPIVEVRGRVRLGDESMASGAPTSPAVGSHPAHGSRRVGAEGRFTGSTPATRYGSAPMPATP